MPHLNPIEAADVTDAFLITLYGGDNFEKLKDLKDSNNFLSERDFITWVIGVVSHCKCNNIYTAREDELQSYISGPDIKVEDDENDVRGVSGVANSPKYEENECDEINMEGEAGGEYDQVDDSILPIRPHNISTYGQCDVDTSYSEIKDNSCFEVHGTVRESTIPRYFSEEVIETPGKKRHHCPFCSYKSDFTTAVRKHVIAVHERIKPYACSQCSYSSAQEQQLKLHMRSKHGVKSKYTCDVCGSGFEKQFKLEMHQSKKNCFAFNTRTFKQQF